MFPADLIKWIFMQKLAWIYMHRRRQRCKIDNFEFDISIYPNIGGCWKKLELFAPPKCILHLWWGKSIPKIIDEEQQFRYPSISNRGTFENK